MSIEFRCRKCNKKLRVADTAAGKQGSCPSCGEKFVAPAPGADPPRQSIPPVAPKTSAPPPAPPIPVGVAVSAPPPGFSAPVQASVPAFPLQTSLPARSEHAHSGAYGRHAKRGFPVVMVVAATVVAFGGGLGLAYLGWQWLKPGQPVAANINASSSQGATVPGDSQNSPAGTDGAGQAAGAATTGAAEGAPPANAGATKPADNLAGQAAKPPAGSQKNAAAAENDPPAAHGNSAVVPPSDDDASPLPSPETPADPPGANAPPTTPAGDAGEENGKTPPVGENAESAPAGDEKKPPKKGPTSGKTPAGKPPAGKTPKNPRAQKPDDEPEHAFGPDGVCLVCRGRMFVPHEKQPVYVHVEGEPAPKPEACVPWRFCPHCQKERAAQELVDAEAQRLLTATDKHKDWEQRAQTQFVRVETRHATLHVALPVDVARRQGLALEALVNHLQTITRSTLLTQSRPNTLDMLIFPDTAAYQKFLGLAAGFPEFSGVTNFELLKQTSGWNSNSFTIQNAGKVPNLPPEHMTLSLFAARNIRAATEQKGRDWFHTGFQYYCEKAITGQNRVHSIRYQLGEPVLSQDWNADLKRFAQQGKLRQLADLFLVELRFFTTADHLESFSVVSFLIKSDPRKFIKLVEAIAQGQEDQAALEAVYGKPLKDLQNDWARWAAAQ